MKNRAFTLIELLAVITIIGILAAIIIPTAGRVRQSAHQARCLSHLRQIGLAILLFTDENKGEAPRAVGNGVIHDINSQTDGQAAWVYQLFYGGYTKGWKMYDCGAQDSKRSYTMKGVKITLDYGANHDLLDKNESHFTRIQEVVNPATVPLVTDSSFSLVSGNTPEGRSRVYNAKTTASAPPFTIDPSLKRHPGGSAICFVDGHARMLDQETIYNGTGGNPVFNFRPDGK